MAITAFELAKIKYDRGIEAAEEALRGLTRDELSLLAGEFRVLESLCDEAEAAEPVNEEE